MSTWQLTYLKNFQKVTKKRSWTIVLKIERFLTVIRFLVLICTYLEKSQESQLLKNLIYERLSQIVKVESQNLKFMYQKNLLYILLF